MNDYTDSCYNLFLKRKSDEMMKTLCRCGKRSEHHNENIRLNDARKETYSGKLEKEKV
jgi:3-methyladenine DNA glycosylase AlkC